MSFLGILPVLINDCFAIGPYLNAETTAGGVPLWVTSTVPGEFRTNATPWTDTYRPWTDKIIGATVKNQVTEGGPVLCGFSSSLCCPAQCSSKTRSHADRCSCHKHCAYTNETKSLVDNEYSQSPDTHAQYFAELEAQYREGGIVVPL